MAVIRNKHTSSLGLPMGGPELRSGSDTNVERWDQIKDHPVVKQWLAAGVLEVVERQAEPEASAPAPVAKPAAPKKAKSAC